MEELTETIQKYIDQLKVYIQCKDEEYAKDHPDVCSALSESNNWVLAFLAAAEKAKEERKKKHEQSNKLMNSLISPIIDNWMKISVNKGTMIGNVIPYKCGSDFQSGYLKAIKKASDEIVNETQDDFQSYGIDSLNGKVSYKVIQRFLDNLDKKFASLTDVKNELDQNNIGIDCSGFVTRVLNELYYNRFIKDNKYTPKQIAKQSFSHLNDASKLKIEGSDIINEITDVLPGDIMRTVTGFAGNFHIKIVVNTEYKYNNTQFEITTAESTSTTNGITIHSMLIDLHSRKIISIDNKTKNIQISKTQISNINEKYETETESNSFDTIPDVIVKERYYYFRRPKGNNVILNEDKQATHANNAGGTNPVYTPIEEDDLSQDGFLISSNNYYSNWIKSANLFRQRKNGCWATTAAILSSFETQKYNSPYPFDLREPLIEEYDEDKQQKIADWLRADIHFHRLYQEEKGIPYINSNVELFFKTFCGFTLSDIGLTSFTPKTLKILIETYGLIITNSTTINTIYFEISQNRDILNPISMENVNEESLRHRGDIALLLDNNNLLQIANRNSIQNTNQQVLQNFHLMEDTTNGKIIIKSALSHYRIIYDMILDNEENPIILFIDSDSAVFYYKQRFNSFMQLNNLCASEFTEANSLLIHSSKTLEEILL